MRMSIYACVLVLYGIIMTALIAANFEGVQPRLDTAAVELRRLSSENRMLKTEIERLQYRSSQVRVRTYTEASAATLEKIAAVGGRVR